jgi:hypothetical protein
MRNLVARARYCGEPNAAVTAAGVLWRFAGALVPIRHVTYMYRLHAYTIFIFLFLFFVTIFYRLRM